MLWTFFVLIASGSALALLLGVYLPRWRLRRALREPFPDHWLASLQRLPFYSRLPRALQGELRHKIKAFLHQKEFVGCEGLVVDDGMRVQIAAAACLLLLNRPSTGYRSLHWIYLFPGEFRSRIPERDENGVVSHASGTLAGLSFENGRVVLAWESVQAGFGRPDDGYNVVLHEFAHQLDQEDGSADGAPLLYAREDYEAWSTVFNAEFDRLHEILDRGGESPIDPYGATDPAEFFAVVTELFYERPGRLADYSPALFDTLSHYYPVDPRQWQGPGIAA